MGQVIFEVPGPGQYAVTADPSLPALENPGNAAEVLDGQQFYQADNTPVTGTMPNNGAVNETLAAGGSYTIPAGYHNGEGSVAAQSLASQTPGTATAADIMQGETAWVNGAQVTGTATPGSVAADATATAGQILAPYTAYVASGKVTGTIPTNDDADVTINGAQVRVAAGYFAQAVSKAIPTVAQAVPSISVSDAGLITATATQNAGYVAQGTQSATQQLTVQGAQTITPGTAVQTIAAGRYLTGAQTIQGDANLVAGNIKDGVSIFGVQGTYEGESTGFAASLVVTVESGATVTAKHGETTLTEVSNGTATFTLTEPGEWTVSAVLVNGEPTGTGTVNVVNSYAILLEAIPSLAYLGTIDPLSVVRQEAFATNIGEYLLFAGGNVGTANFTDAVDAYTSDLVHSVPTPLSEERGVMGAVTIGNYALFGLGWTDSSVSLRTVETFSQNLTLGTASNATRARGYVAAAANANYALFGGGGVRGNYSTTPHDDVDAYSTTLTHTIATTLTENGQYAAASVGEYVIFNSIGVAYNENLTQVLTEETQVSGGYYAGAASVTGYALFASGSSFSSSSSINIVDVYDTTLTKSLADNLFTPRAYLASASTEDFAVFAGGMLRSGGPYSAAVEYYTNLLVHEAAHDLSKAGYLICGGAINDIILFGGGTDSSRYANVDAFRAS